MYILEFLEALGRGGGGGGAAGERGVWYNWCLNDRQDIMFYYSFTLLPSKKYAQ